MQEPLLWGIPLSLVFLYFIWYSMLGWAMETTYCSIKQGHFVYRGFLHGPVCPIYGVGALLMVLVLNRFTGNIPVFFLVSTVTMSAWEYFVGWLLETTTHIKYWDYSDQKFNLKGRICLKNSLYWGVVSYIAIYWIHPWTVHLFDHLKALPRWILSGVLALAMLADTVTTIRSLALTTVFLKKAEAARKELEEKRQELEEKRQEFLRTGQQKLEEAALQAALLGLELRQTDLTDLLEEAAHHSRRFRLHYDHMTSTVYRRSMQRIRQGSEQLRERRAQRMACRKAERAAKKAGK